MNLYLVRHGETAWSLSGQHTSRTDIPLTAHGEEEARTLSERLRRVTFSRVFTSPRQRAWRTYELLGLDATAEIEPDLAEWDYGDYEGQRSVDIRRSRPDWNLFRDGCPHGESPADVSERADRLIVRLRTLPGNVAIFSHGHFGRVLAARWIGLPVEHAEHFLLSTASLSILGYEQNAAGPAVVLWNAVSNHTVASAPDPRGRDTGTAANTKAITVSPLAGKPAPAVADEEVAGLEDPAVGGNEVAGGEHENVAGHDRVRVDSAFDAVAHDAARERQTFLQLLDRRRGTVLLVEAEQGRADDDGEDDSRVHPLGETERHRRGEDQDQDERASDLPPEEAQRTETLRVFDAVRTHHR